MKTKIRDRNRVINYAYLFGAMLINAGVVAQIVKTYSTKSVEDIAILWLICLAIGETFTSPRIFTSVYWVWKVAQVTLICLIVILLAGVWLYMK